jgi:hypothetical protein
MTPGDINAHRESVTIFEMLRWLQNVADEASKSGEDMVINMGTPSDRIITLNGYSVDDTSAALLYEGSIIQDDKQDH